MFSRLFTALPNPNKAKCSVRSTLCPFNALWHS
jgi:hypothetical protein